MSSTLAIDAYHLTTLVAHCDAGRLGHRVAMAFFFRKLPARRNYVVLCGLRSILAHAAAMRLDAEDWRTIRGHPVIGPAVASRPALVSALEDLRGFEGDIDAMPEGTLAFAGPGWRTGGEPFELEGRQANLYEPLLQVETDLPRSKFIETPWLGRLNSLSMVASKAARVVTAAAGGAVLEFGQRRTHPDAAADAARAAWIAGCAASSNMLAAERHGVPVTGTMDHFLVQSAERPGVPPADTEKEVFAEFYRAFPDQAILLVDTYDTMRGIRSAVEATGGRLAGIRVDSGVTPDLVRAARALLDELGAPQARVVCSDQLDEDRVAELRAAGADSFGVGENIVCSPDSATGIGAVAKIVRSGHGRETMKLSPGKVSLPGLVQVHRTSDHDLLTTEDEPGPPGSRPLLVPVWRGREPAGGHPEPDEAVRNRVAEGLAGLPPHLRGLDVGHGRPWPLVVSDRLAARIEACAREVRG